ncbi:MAG: ERCC4 domain-containing protein [Candidatus Parvarchaeum sp.]
MTVIVDIYEVSNNKKTEEQLKKINIDYEVVSLTKGGDYLIEGKKAKIVIERKEISDLFNSNHEGRLAKQMNKLMTEYPDYKKILLVEGQISSLVRYSNSRKVAKGGIIDYSGHATGNPYARYSAEFSGIVNSLIVETDINVIQVSSKWQTITLLKNLDEWAEGKRSASKRSTVSKAGRDDIREIEDLLMSIHGIGWGKVKNLLKEYPSIISLAKDIIDGNNAEIKKKLGEALGSHIIEIFKREVKSDEIS